MKYLISAFLLYCMIMLGCGGNDKTKLEAYNAEAFAYDLDGNWEVNATTRVKGFFQKEQNGTYAALLSYDIDLITPAGDTIKSMISRTEDKMKNEEMMDVDLETQFNLDSTYAEGNYQVIFNVKDMNTEQIANSSAEFNIEKE